MRGIQRQTQAALAGSISVISYGMAYGWVSPIIDDLVDEDGEFQATQDQISWIAADIDIGCMITPFIASYLMNKFGRKWPILCSVPLLMVSWVLTITTRSVRMLYVKRLLEGMGAGLVMTVTPVFLAEIAEARVRGSIMLTMGITWYTGILLQFCIGSYLSYNTSAWINLVLPIISFIHVLYVPESPYYLMMAKQENKAAESLAWYCGLHTSQVTDKLNSIAVYLEKDVKIKKSWRAALNNKACRKSFYVMAVVVLAAIMSGMTTIIVYTTEMFSGTQYQGFLSLDACSLAIGTLFLVTNVAISLIIDKIGRRPLLIVSAFGCCFSNLSSAFYFYFKDEIKFRWVPFATIGSYCFSLSIGLSPVLTTYQGELFPVGLRAFASAMTMMLITSSSIATIRLYIIIKDILGVYVNYLIYGVVTGVSAIFFYFYAPETKTKTLDELFNEFYLEKKVVNTEELNTLTEVRFR